MDVDVQKIVLDWLPHWSIFLTAMVLVLFGVWQSKYPPFKSCEKVGPVPDSFLIPILAVGFLTLGTGVLQLVGDTQISNWWGGWLGFVLSILGVLSVVVFGRVKEYYPNAMIGIVVGLTATTVIATILWWSWPTWYLLLILLILLILYLIWIGSVVLVCGSKRSTTPPPAGVTACTPAIASSVQVTGGVPADYTAAFKFTASSSLSHALGVVTVDKVEIPAGLLWANLAANQYTTTPGDPTAVTPETKVDVTTSLTVTGRRKVRVTTSYTCPICNAQDTDVIEKVVNR